MKVVVTGGTGMIGRKLIDSLLAMPELIDRDGNMAEVTAITAFDVVAPNPPLPKDFDRLQQQPLLYCSPMKSSLLSLQQRLDLRIPVLPRAPVERLGVEPEKRCTTSRQSNKPIQLE